ncbi:bifunctional (p)ppGpp synthetase/guanosine-3',5'-bis(diphosphate) 3'-pyrophosphohydrolase [Candidatus Peregrinibacteria bacterium]|nr:bifunctional (p)ppGpp synthetase/guanosine-3',5'-bis(diphosphate) 3'-pyrophosphohydrolase [Candidatus Peregrinibacteria bacterium]
MLVFPMGETAASALAPFLSKLEKANVKCDSTRLRAAYALAEHLYGQEQHWTGIPVFEHVMEVIGNLLPFEPDEDTVIACLLHHVLYGRHISLTELEEQFGPKVKSLVSAVHLLSHVTMNGRRNSIEDLRLMLLTVSEDVRVVLIILCDQCAVLDHLSALALEQKRHLCHDTLNLFAPVAARLGIHALKQRMEKIAFPVIYPSDAERIDEQLKQVHDKYGFFLSDASYAIARVLQEHGVQAEVWGREKQPYSIFMKMKAKSLTHVQGLHDLFAFRVIVANPEECYQALGVLHRLGRPFANRFKDFIAFPKPNGYQSLHTTIARLPGVPEALFIEVQVRTDQMHREAEYGIAAHWSYKEGGTTDQVIHRVQLQKVLSSQYSVGEEGEEITSALADHIFVLTPKGDIVELPEGATPLDFAFQIHTDLGLSFRAARVNGSIVPLDHELENGDVVEIIKHRIPNPSPEWMQLLKMASSRSRLKRYLYALNRDEYVASGKELLNAELQKHRLPHLDNDLSLLKYYDGRVLTMSDREDVLLKIGQGAEKPASILTHMPAVPGLACPLPKKQPRLQRKDAIVEIEGGVQMPMRFAKCCKAQEAVGDEITGFITRTGEVTVHRDDCRMVRFANPERQIAVRWRVAAEAKQ